MVKLCTDLAPKAAILAFAASSCASNSRISAEGSGWVAGWVAVAVVWVIVSILRGAG
jgi:hypothetical protein